ncbi:hypothetical protein Pelo_16200 [Pelomyxa schiedti]|nr:hypothetical protein Pelo_16200 [Pelomyxa schiedti]
MYPQAISPHQHPQQCTHCAQILTHTTPSHAQSPFSSVPTPPLSDALLLCIQRQPPCPQSGKQPPTQQHVCHPTIAEACPCCWCWGAPFHPWHHCHQTGHPIIVAGCH